jgi:hypothetical protein
MELFYVNFVPVAGLWLTFFGCYSSFKGCSRPGCDASFRYKPCAWLFLLTVTFSLLTIYANGSPDAINGRFTSKSAREKISKQLSESISKLQGEADLALELEHIRAAMSQDYTDVLRWRDELPESKELKDLETRVGRLVDSLNQADAGTLKETLFREREKLLK